MIEKRVLRVGITGGIGSGKSVICRLFGMLGAACYDSDSRAKSLMADDAGLIRRIKERFGDDIYGTDGLLDRGLLAMRSFADSESLRDLNSIVHPAVMENFEKWAKEYDLKSAEGEYEAGYVLMESAIIFDNGIQRFLDSVITVSAPVGIRIERVVSRDKADRRRIEARISNQMSDEEREELANHIIINDGLIPLWKQVSEIDETLKESARRLLNGCRTLSDA